ncbi:hypothetical protein B296_00021086 [Ensete ventricosum]|uniref:Uncharacterized protein n=1 Tax=Ensete ventricosum TaxID=4639 RepID=A0A426YJQ6_ENSVE|nr:hypothetical protein B296_00021086 [Ensete ventricosum]
MSQERPFGNSGAEHRSEHNHSQSTEEVTTAASTPNRFWRMMTDPGFPSPASNPASFVVTTEAFLGLTNQVQALAGMVQTIVPYLPQLIQSTTQQSAPPMAFSRSEVGKRPAHDEDLDITFKSGGEEYPCHDDVLVISIRMANTYVKRVMIDMGSSTDI